jgi:hypothetical protein
MSHLSGEGRATLKRFENCWQMNDVGLRATFERQGVDRDITTLELTTRVFAIDSNKR